MCEMYIITSPVISTTQFTSTQMNQIITSAHMNQICFDPTYVLNYMIYSVDAYIIRYLLS